MAKTGQRCSNTTVSKLGQNSFSIIDVGKKIDEGKVEGYRW